MWSVLLSSSWARLPGGSPRHVRRYFNIETTFKLLQRHMAHPSRGSSRDNASQHNMLCPPDPTSRKMFRLVFTVLEGRVHACRHTQRHRGRPDHTQLFDS